MVKIETLYDKISQLEEQGKEPDQIGYLFCKTLYHVKNKKNKFVSKLEKDANRKTVRNVQKNLLKAVNEDFPPEYDDLAEAENFHDLQLSRDELDSIESAVFRALRKEGDPYAKRFVFEKIGRSVKSAEQVYSESAKRDSIDFSREYRILLNYLKREL